ncbi:MAG TPA: FAD:protein FMN transferase [Patescibacteria group bacterium]|nr:FAD:protein FMN transferase [Patescibacteria group bacterium]
MMGTFVQVSSPRKEAAGIVFAEMKRIERLLSKYDPASEVSQLNRLGKLRASPETFYIISKSKEFWSLSNGAFDITVGPLMDVWGFTDKKYREPTDAEIRDALQRVGSDKIILKNNGNVVEFSAPQMRIDLGGIAKGYGLDCAVKKLKEAGITSCLINAGGQIYALGTKYGKPWRIGTRNPRPGSLADSPEYWELADQSAATSGDYEQYFVQGRKRYSHIIDPKTGSPVASGVIAVTVVAPDGLTADALSTAVFVLGRAQGEALVKKIAGAKIIKCLE